MFRFSNQSIVPSKFVFGVGNFGVIFDNVPVTGENGASVLLNDGGVSGVYVRLRIVDVAPTITSLFVYENGAFESEGYGQWTYYDSKNGIENAEISTVTIAQPVNVVVADTFASLQSSVSITTDVGTVNISITNSLPALSSSMGMTSVVPEFNLAITDTLPSLQSSVSLVNGVPVSNIEVSTTLPALVSAVEIVNLVPTYSLSVSSTLAALQTAMSVSYEDNIPTINISDVLPALQSTMTITRTVPEYALTINSSFGALQSSVNIINGQLTIYVSSKNLITLPSKSRIIQLR